LKKVLIAQDLNKRYLQDAGFLNRAFVTAFTADTNDDILKVHIEHKVDLIITQLYMPGIRSEDLFGIIRQSKDMRDVLTIITCEDTLAQRERCKQCGANAVLTTPLDSALLQAKIQQFLDVAPRQAYRVALNVAVEGKFKDQPFLYRTENISATGILIKAKEGFAQSDKVTFSFFLPDGTRITARGEIARIIKLAAEPGAVLYGINYKEIASDVKAALETFVNKQVEYNSVPVPRPDTEIDKPRKKP
jgi:CheY-like chemotaxis protein